MRRHGRLRASLAKARRAVLFAVLALTHPGVTCASEPDVPDVRFSAGYGRCMARDDSHAHMGECLRQEQDLAEAALNAAWHAVLARVSSAHRLALRREERQWIARREQACEAMYQEMNNGNGAGQAEADCLARYAIHRTAELRRLR